VKFDPVHDSQAAHRALVKAFSYPGAPVSLKESMTGAGEIPWIMAVLGQTLLDPETSFSGRGVAILGELTGARRKPEPEAAFVFVNGWDEAVWSDAFTRAGRGTLSDPHLGATIVAWAERETPGRAWTATGPGIEKPLALFLPGYGVWVQARAEACKEFPLGVDLIWARDDGTVVALPRTTRLVSAERRE
jgi:alpha-D-ribose 1-methylphosphonate 5-triphosphate synthase subunit PhnH